ncbi:MAG: hypothetical protein HOE90_06700 [Bacteriovoracaceae bacterium]|nr:hypothetical protein [Bacteriovoracaceae bacterium]
MINWNVFIFLLVWPFGVSGKLLTVKKIVTQDPRFKISLNKQLIKKSGFVFDELHILKDSKTILLHRPKAYDAKFKKLYTVDIRGEVYFVSTWTKGVHGQTIKIFKSKSNDPIFTYHSAWQVVTSKIKDGGLKIVGKKTTTDSSGVPQDEIKFWRP